MNTTNTTLPRELTAAELQQAGGGLQLPVIILPHGRTYSGMGKP